MKKSLIAGVAAIAVVAGGTAAFALTAGAQDLPQAPPAPTTTASAEPTASATAEPTSMPAEPVESAYPEADEDAFLALVHRDWQGEGLPEDAALLAAGYDRCGATAEYRVEHQDDFWPEWSGANNMMVGFAAEYFLCPAAG